MNEIAIFRDMEITRDQCRAARGILRMTQGRLARNAGVGLSTVTDFELGTREISPRLIHAIRIALEKEGIRFDDNGGVKPIPGWRKPK
jgi:transcriptional regulator with XRE-family HTH domain